MSSAKNAILKAKIEGIITELMVKTDAANVYVDESTTLAAKLTSIIADIATKASTDQLTEGLATKAAATHTHAQSEVTGLTDALALLASTESVNTAIDALRQEMLGDTPVEAYNTFTELAAYISEHQEVSDALSAAIGMKADKATTLAGYGIEDAYNKTEVDTALAGKSAVNVDNEFKSNLNIYNVTKEEYAAMKTAGTLDPEALYFVEDEDIDLSGYATVDHNHNDVYYIKTEVDTKIADAISSATGGESAASVKASLDAYKTSNDARVDALEADTHTHANKTVLDGISAENVSAWSAKSDSNIYYSATEPANLTDKDLWVQLV